MSRNLDRRDCQRCQRNVALVGGQHPITREEAGVYLEEYDGLIVANAECQFCGAKYLAWMQWGNRKGDRAVGPAYRAYFDLSFRSSFNNEPGQGDLPEWNGR